MVVFMATSPPNMASLEEENVRVEPQLKP